MSRAQSACLITKSTNSRGAIRFCSNKSELEFCSGCALPDLVGAMMRMLSVKQAQDTAAFFIPRHVQVTLACFGWFRFQKLSTCIILIQDPEKQ